MSSTNIPSHIPLPTIREQWGCAMVEAHQSNERIIKEKGDARIERDNLVKVALSIIGSTLKGLK